MSLKSHFYRGFFAAFMGLQLPMSILSNALSTLYIVSKLKVNANIKIILGSNAMMNLLANLVSWIGYFFVVVLDQRDAMSCAVFLLPQVFTFTTSIFFSALLSTVRFLIASKASNGEIVG